MRLCCPVLSPAPDSLIYLYYRFDRCCSSSKQYYVVVGCFLTPKFYLVWFSKGFQFRFTGWSYNSRSLSPFPLLGIPDKENVSSYSLCLASKNCQKVKNNHGNLTSKESSLFTFNRAINIVLILFWHLWWVTLKYKGEKVDCYDMVITCPWH